MRPSNRLLHLTSVSGKISACSPSAISSASPGYWQAHAVKDKSCDGARVAELFVKMAGAFKPVGNVDEAISILIEKRLFNSREYWMPCTVAGGACSGELVAGVVEKFVHLVEAR